MPKIAATLLVRDEEDIIAENLRHHLSQGVDYFIVTNNASKDRTEEIVRSFSQVAVVINEFCLSYRQADWVRRMSDMVYEIGADWVIHLDADEFWSGLNHLEHIDPEFLVVNSGDHLTATLCSGKTCRDFVHITDRANEGFNREYYRYFRYSNYKPMKGCKVAHRCRKGMKISQGNHEVFNVPESQTTFCPSLRIDHYPIRSFEHFRRKVVNGGSAYIHSGLSEQIGSHWREWYQVYLADQLELEYRRFSYTTKQAEELVIKKELYVCD